MHTRIVSAVGATVIRNEYLPSGVVEAGAALPFDNLVLDGEVAVFDQQRRSRCDWLRATPAGATSGRAAGP
jgi:hypothetical protein